MAAAQSYDLSIVIPLLNEEKNVPLLYEKLLETLDEMGRTFELIFVDDGSTDLTFKVLSDLHEKDERVHIIRFTRNFGKSGGYAAGFDLAAGDIIVTMDGDLQDDPTDIPKVIEQIDAGYDLVVGWKTEGADPVAGKSLPSWIFNRVSARLTGLKIHDMNCPFKAYRSNVAKSISRELHGELFRYQPLLARRDGYTIKEVTVQNLPRVHGETKYGFSKFLRGFLDLLTVVFLTKFTSRPLHLFGTIGLLASGLGSLIIVALYVQKIFWGIGVGNYLPLFLLSILMVIFGAQIFSIGLVSEMIAMNDKDPAGKYTIKEIIN